MGQIFDFPYRTVAEISLQALRKNLATLRSSSRRELIPVVKANAYGHGMIPVAKVLLNKGDCHLLAVATLEEAIELRKHFYRPFGILVLSGFLPHQLDAYIRHNLTPMIHTLGQLQSLKGKNHLPPLHLKLDTGMNRLGLKGDHVWEALDLLRSQQMKLSGLATHFANAEEKVSPFVNEQIEKFEAWFKEFQSQRCLHTDARIHFSNSAGILARKLGFSNAVRPGLAMYGISPTFGEKTDLVPVLQWKTRVLVLKDLEAGETVGYGRTYTAKRKERIAILPVGYADGFPRKANENATVILGGKKIPLRGRVSMDLLAVDVTDVENVREGSLAVLIGGDGKQTVSVHDLANAADTVPYEILCGISDRVCRIYLDSDAT